MVDMGFRFLFRGRWEIVSKEPEAWFRQAIESYKRGELPFHLEEL